MEKAGKLKRIPFADRAQMKKLADPVMAEYAKEIGADGDLQQDQLDVTREHAAAGAGSHACAGLFLPAVGRVVRGSACASSSTATTGCSTCCSALSVGILVVPVTLQMISRFTALIPAWIWTEEMARFLFIWMVMLGAMIGVRDGTHFDVDVWPELKPRANALLRIVSIVFVLVFALVFVWYGIKFVQFGWDQTSELADLPMAYIFIAWPLTGLTWLLFGFERLLRDLRIASPTWRRRRANRHGSAYDARARHGERRMTGAALTPGVAALWLFGTFFLLMVLRVPVAFALGLACLPVLFIEPRLSPMVVFNTTFKAYNSFILLAVPFFLLTANLMNVGGITDRLVTLSRTMVGNFPGALAQINVLLSVFFAGISGLVDGRRGEPGQDLHRGAGQGRLRPVVLDRDHRGVGGAGGDHPAVDPDGRLGRRAVRCRSARSISPASSRAC